MDSLSAFEMGRAHSNDTPMVFDWDKAARLIVERNAQAASAGLRSDWKCTGGEIWNGKPVRESYTYLASTWATPELNIDGDVEDCYVMGDTTEWDEDTKWPKSALAIVAHD